MAAILHKVNHYMTTEKGTVHKIRNNDMSIFVYYMMVSRFRHIFPGHYGRLTALLCLLLLLPAALLARPGDKPMNRPYADLKPWHLGFSVGAHVQDLSFTHNGYVTPEGERWVAEVPSFSPGFCVDVLAELRLHRWLSLRFTPGMYFGSKGIEMIDYAAEERRTQRQNVKSALVALPLDLKVAGDRMRNVRPYLTLGAMATFDVGKKRTETLMFNKGDFFLTAGLGLDFYLPYFKLDPEIKFCFGMTDVLRHKRPDLADDPQTMKMTASLSKVKQSMVVITFHFE